MKEENLESTFDINDTFRSEEAYDPQSLCEKTLYEALQGGSRLYHTPEEYYSIYPDEQSIDNGISENFYYFPHGRRLQAVIALERHISVSRVLRIETLQGLALFNRGIGEGIKEKFKAMSARIKANDGTLFETLDRINCNFDFNFQTKKSDRSTFDIEKKYSSALSSYSTMCCIPKDKLITILQMLSLRTEPELSGYVKVFDENIKRFESRQIYREEQTP